MVADCRFRIADCDRGDPTDPLDLADLFDPTDLIDPTDPLDLADLIDPTDLISCPLLNKPSSNMA
jgi:hypothetical protein